MFAHAWATTEPPVAFSIAHRHASSGARAGHRLPAGGGSNGDDDACGGRVGGHSAGAGHGGSGGGNASIL